MYVRIYRIHFYYYLQGVVISDNIFYVRALVFTGSLILILIKAKCSQGVNLEESKVNYGMCYADLTKDGNINKEKNPLNFAYRIPLLIHKQLSKRQLPTGES